MVLALLNERAARGALGGVVTRDECCGFMPPITARCPHLPMAGNCRKPGRETARFAVDGLNAHADRNGQKHHLVGRFEDKKSGPEMAQTLLKEKAKNV